MSAGPDCIPGPESAPFVAFWIERMRIVCPTCQKVIDDAPADFAPRPFCSAQCKWVDLGNWLNESYRFSEPIDALEDGEGERRKPN